MLTFPPVLDSPVAMSVGSTVVERCHALVSWIRSSTSQVEDVGNIIGVTSCSPGSGVSTVAASLAVAAAQICERPALLLDLSCSHSLLAARLDISGELGLRKALEPYARASECVKASSIPNLSLLAMNEPDALHALTVASGKLNGLLRELEQEFDFIVVDLPSTDSGLCYALGGMLTGVLLVVEANRTHSEAAVRAKRRLIHANAAVLGVIMNKVP